MSNKQNKKDKLLNNIVRVLTVACGVAAVVLVAVIALALFGSDEPPTVSITDEKTETGASLQQTTATETTTAPITYEYINNEPTITATTTEETSTTKETTGEETSKQDEAVTTTKVPELPKESDRIIVNPEQEKWNLVVVNSGREMPEGYVPKLTTVAGTSVKMDYRVAPWYDKMYYAAKKDGITLTPYSGYRSYERQKINYNNLTDKYMNQYGLSRADAAAKAATVILPPGTSEHNLGLAMDICNTYDSFANQKEYKWLTEHAHEYGFILRYTAEKQHITGIVPEPWHWRYVGTEYAEKIKNSGLCLEEYLDSIGISY